MRDAWKALISAQLGWALDAMDFLLFTFALRSIQAEFGLHDSVMGLLTSVALIAGAAGGILFGRLADPFRAGPRDDVEHPSLFGVHGAARDLVDALRARPLAERRRARHGRGVVVGLGPRLRDVAAEKRAKAMGLMQSGWAIGALAAAGLAALLLEPYGWRVLFLVGAFPAVVAFIIRRTVRSRRSGSAPSGRRRDTPLLS